jgi:hypothetical protein
MTARPRRASPRAKICSATCSDSWRLLAATGSSWQTSRFPAFPARGVLLSPAVARSCQRMSGDTQDQVRPRGFEPMTCGSGGNRTQVVSRAD